jgi:hypothetical protein
MPTRPPTSDDETTAHHIPGWDRSAWAVRGVKDATELIWQREASVDITYIDGGVEDTFAPELVRTDQAAIDGAGAAVHVGLTVSISRMPRTSRRPRRESSLRRWSSWPTTPTACADRRVSSTGR